MIVSTNVCPFENIHYTRHYILKAFVQFTMCNNLTLYTTTLIQDLDFRNEDDSEDDEDPLPKNNTGTPKRERLTRRDLVDISREGKDKRDGSKDSRMSDKRSPARKEDGKKEDSAKKVKQPKKEEIKEVKVTEEIEDKNKKVRISL